MKLKPFDKVLVRDEDDESWEIDIFGRYEEDEHVYPYRCISEHYRQCIPYEGNESLLGTTRSPEPEFNDGDPVIVWNNYNPNYKYVKVFKCKVDKMYRTYLFDNECQYESWDNCIPFKLSCKE